MHGKNWSSKDQEIKSIKYYKYFMFHVGIVILHYIWFEGFGENGKERKGFGRIYTLLFGWLKWEGKERKGNWGKLREMIVLYFKHLVSFQNWEEREGKEKKETKHSVNNFIID